MVSNNLIDWHNNPREQFELLERQLDLRPTEMARAIGVPYDNYKKWKSGRYNLTPVTFRCIELLVKFPKTARKLAKEK